MKLFFSLVFAATLCTSVQIAFANHIRAPQIPLFLKSIGSSNQGCGIITGYIGGGPMNQTLIAYIDEEEYPFKIITSYEEYYIDKNRDGHIDEYFSSRKDFLAKYPYSCDPITK